MEINKTKSKWLKGATILGIIIVLNLFFNYAITLFYEAPEWNNFCTEKQGVEKIENENRCLEKGGEWLEWNKGRQAEDFRLPNPALEEGYCNINFECNKAFDLTYESYEGIVFIILVLLGVVSIVAGILVAGISGVVATGLSYGGVLSLIIASMRYWSSAGNFLRFGILAVALIILIWFAIKKFKD